MIKENNIRHATLGGVVATGLLSGIFDHSTPSSNIESSVDCVKTTAYRSKDISDKRDNSLYRDSYTEVLSNHDEGLYVYYALNVLKASLDENCANRAKRFLASPKGWNFGQGNEASVRSLGLLASFVTKVKAPFHAPSVFLRTDGLFTLSISLDSSKEATLSFMDDNSILCLIDGSDEYEEIKVDSNKALELLDENAVS